MYSNGEGVEKDLKIAALWYRKAALQGHAVAQDYLEDILKTIDTPVVPIENKEVNENKEQQPTKPDIFAHILFRSSIQLSCSNFSS